MNRKRYICPECSVVFMKDDLMDTLPVGESPTTSGDYGSTVNPGGGDGLAKRGFVSVEESNNFNAWNE